MEKDLKAHKILIIEDEASLLNVLSDRFTDEGFVVLKAGNGEEGLRIALNEHPDIILLDIIMPTMDGLTMLSKLRQDEWGKTVSVMMLTNVNDSDKISEAMSNNIQRFLVKSDWKLEDIVAEVKERFDVEQRIK